MHEITIIASPNAKHQVSHQEALGEGFSKHGIKAHFTRGRPMTKHVACWGWRKGKTLRAQGHEVLVIERGYLGDRFRWTSLAWNGLNGHATFPEIEVTPERFTDNFKMKPWKEGGDYVLVLGQVPGDASLKGKDLNPWYEKTAKQCVEIHGLPVVFRPHPLSRISNIARNGIRWAKVSSGDLADDFAGAALAVTYNSNSGVDAVLSGVPTVTMDAGSMAWDVTSHRLDEVIRPDRSQWAHQLAWRQWSMSEITSGVALNGIMEVING